MVRERKCTEDTYALLFKALIPQESVHTGPNVEKGFRGGCEEGTREQDQICWGRDGSASLDQIKQQPCQSCPKAALHLGANDYYNLHPTALPADTAGTRHGSGLQTGKKLHPT